MGDRAAVLNPPLEDLDAVAEHLPAEGGNGGASPAHGRWVRALAEARFDAGLKARGPAQL